MMILVVVESLVVKGLLSLGHWIAAHSTSAVVVKGGAIVTKTIATQGIANTVAAFGGTVVATGFIVGTIVWTTENIKLLQDGLEALQKADYKTAAWKLGWLATNMNLKVEMLPNAVENFLVKINVPLEDAHKLGRAIANLESEIIKYTK